MTNASPIAPPVLTDDNALFLDFDGTLVGFARIPKDVTVDPGLVPIIEHLRDKLGGALAVVTGREISDITEQLAPLVLPVAGSHGAERRRTDGGIEMPGDDVREKAVQLNEALFAELGHIPGMIVEHKAFSVSLHYRNVPEAEDRVIAVAEDTLGRLPGWEGVKGKMVIEIRPAAFSKASAVHAFMAEKPFAGRIPVFVGDDTTDEDGMRAATELGGYGIKVGKGDSVARYRLADPDAVHAWLASAG